MCVALLELVVCMDFLLILQFACLQWAGGLEKAGHYHIGKHSCNSKSQKVEIIAKRKCKTRTSGEMAEKMRRLYKNELLSSWKNEGRFDKRNSQQGSNDRVICQINPIPCKV